MKLHRSSERHRGNKALELLRPKENGQSLAFDPRVDLSPEEKDWIKRKAHSSLKNGKYGCILSTAWMRWLNPEHMKWMRKYPVPGEIIRDCFVRLHSEDSVRQQEILYYLGGIIDVFLDARQDRSEIPDFKNLFNSTLTGMRLYHLSPTINAIKIWPEHREKIIEQAVGNVESFLNDSKVSLTQGPPENLIYYGANLVVLFPETRPWVESLILQHKDRIRQYVQEAARSAKNFRRDKQNPDFIEYQKVLSCMTILESGGSYMDNQGEIQLQPRAAVILAKEQLPDRPHV